MISIEFSPIKVYAIGVHLSSLSNELDGLGESAGCFRIYMKSLGEGLITRIILGKVGNDKKVKPS